ncbi:unnamed protein product [Haemonchus placei]|uniref:Secreted protein n=1 Tax=Haemonchus placei TaxID=6290 RepID=A0A0N4WE38_HAEPC|nr:unnamed protein product [Haemonchus placei]
MVRRVFYRLYFQSNSPGESICVPPVLLSPVLSRPIRSVHPTTTSPLPIHGSVMNFHVSYWCSADYASKSTSLTLTNTVINGRYMAD